jgi:protein-disulfide isomerase
MSDFQCPFCRRFAAETFPILEKEYIATGKVRWIFINYPLTSLHPNAVAAAEFAACAARQGRFWPVHDRIYADQDKWAGLKNPGPFFVAQIAALGLQREPMLSCLERGETRALIRSDAEGAARSGAKSTPSFYIEGGILAGAQPIEVFRQVLDSIVTAKRARKA